MMYRFLALTVVTLLVVALSTMQQCTASIQATATSPFPVQQIALKEWLLYSTATPNVQHSVTVPNTLVGALLEAGVYDFDPFYSNNLDRIDKKQFMVPWVFNTTFNAQGYAPDARFILHLDGLNYNATLMINGIQVENQDTLVGSFQRFKIDITNSINRNAVNQIAVKVFRPPHDPKEVRGKTGLSISFYDWAPHPPDLSMGLWRPAFINVLNGSSPFEIDGLAVKTEVVNQLGENQAYLNVSFVVKNFSPEQQTVPSTYVVLNGVGNGGAPITINANPFSLGPYEETRLTFSHREFASLVLTNPPLWYPWQMGDQRLFPVTVGIVDSSVQLTKQIGLRSVQTSKTEKGALQFYINNVPLQIRAGAWCPDLFLRSNAPRLRQQFQLVRGMNLNAIRLEGKVEYEPFFEIADELGILILADLGCCENWPAWDEYEYSAAANAMRDQVRRFESHASMGWILASSDDLPPPRIEAMFNKIFAEEAWPNAIVSSASQHTSTLTGKTGLKMTGPYSWVPPVYWLQDGAENSTNGGVSGGVHQGEFGGAWGFFTEGGPGEAPMTFNSWNRTVPAGDQWSSQGSLSPAWDFHMGNPNGAFPSLQYFTPPLQTRYGNSSSAPEFLYRSQAANYESIRAMFEGYTRNKHKNATGVVQWMMNNAWPSNLWHLFDSYLVAGGGFYGAQKACSALTASLSLVDGSVVLVNSLFKDFPTTTVNAAIYDLSSKNRWMRSQTFEGGVPADAALTLDFVVPIKGDTLGFAPEDTFFIVLTVATKNTTANENWYWVSPTMDIPDFPASNGFRTPCKQFANFNALTTQLNPTKLTVNAQVNTEAKQGTVTVVNPTNDIAFFVELRLTSKVTSFDLAPQIWSDNYISLLPGASKTLSVDLSQAFPTTAPISNLEDIVLNYNSYNNQVSAASTPLNNKSSMMHGNNIHHDSSASFSSSSSSALASIQVAVKKSTHHD